MAYFFLYEFSKGVILFEFSLSKRAVLIYVCFLGMIKRSI